jgi:hypothetical protein
LGAAKAEEKSQNVQILVVSMQEGRSNRQVKLIKETVDAVDELTNVYQVRISGESLLFYSLL